MCPVFGLMCPVFGPMCPLFGPMCHLFGRRCQLWRGRCPVVGGAPFTVPAIRPAQGRVSDGLRPGSPRTVAPHGRLGTGSPRMGFGDLAWHEVQGCVCCPWRASPGYPQGVPLQECKGCPYRNARGSRYRNARGTPTGMVAPASDGVGFPVGCAEDGRVGDPPPFGKLRAGFGDAPGDRKSRAARSLGYPATRGASTWRGVGEEKRAPTRGAPTWRKRLGTPGCHRAHGRGRRGLR